MTAISIWEPWATAMLLGLKRIETRSWPTSHKGDLLICASKRPLDATAREVLLNIHLHSGFDIQPNPGMALCVVRLIRCDRITEERRGFKALDGREPALQRCRCNSGQPTAGNSDVKGSLCPCRTVPHGHPLPHVAAARTGCGNGFPRLPVHRNKDRAGETDRKRRTG